MSYQMKRRRPSGELGRRNSSFGTSGSGPSTPVVPTPTVLQPSVTASTPGGNVTLNLSAPREVGFYANGDAFILLPPGGEVRISSTVPASLVSTDPIWINTPASIAKPENAINERAIHGMQSDWIRQAVVQPADGEEFTGLDGANQTPTFYPDPGSWTGFDVAYVSNFNVDPGATGGDLVITAPTTLIKARSLLAANMGVNNRPAISDMVFFTVVSEIPPAGSFRPSADAGDKVSHYQTSMINGSLLPRLTWPVGETLPDHAALTARAGRPKYNQSGRHDQQRNLMAENNEASYGEPYTDEVGQFLAALCSDNDYSTKEALAIAVCQMALDIDAFVQTGDYVKAADGNSTGRKYPYVMGALLLQDSAMQARAGGLTLFSEDGQMAVINDAEFANLARDNTVRPRRPYTSEMNGLPEFSGQHYIKDGVLIQPEDAGGHWEMSYRALAEVSQLTAAAAILNVPNGVTVWNRDRKFDYLDRWWSVEQYEGTVNAFWSAWRGLSARTIYRAPPEMMENYTLTSRPSSNNNPPGDGDFITQTPGFTMIKNGPDIRVTLDTWKHRDQSLDALMTYDLRWSSNGGGSWTELNNVSFPLEFVAPLNTEIFVQTRGVHPTAGTGPWSFSWTFWVDALASDLPAGYTVPSDNNTFNYPAITTDVAAQVPLNIAVPTFNMVATAGENSAILTDGDWLSETTITYEWYDNGVIIPSANSATYAGTAGQLLKARVVATNVTGTSFVDGPAVTIAAAAPPYGVQSVFQEDNPNTLAEYQWTIDVGANFAGRTLLIIPSGRGTSSWTGFEVDVDGVAASAVVGSFVSNISSQVAEAFLWTGGGQNITFKARPQGTGTMTRAGIGIVVLSGAVVHDVAINASHTSSASVDVEGPTGIVVGATQGLNEATGYTGASTLAYSVQMEAGIWHSLAHQSGLATETARVINPTQAVQTNKEIIAIAFKESVPAGL